MSSEPPPVSDLRGNMLSWAARLVRLVCGPRPTQHEWDHCAEAIRDVAFDIKREAEAVSVPSERPAEEAALIEAVNGLNLSDNDPYDAWDAAKWRVFNAAVTFVRASARLPEEEGDLG
jgi:hypothetical protein